MVKFSLHLRSPWLPEILPGLFPLHEKVIIENCNAGSDLLLTVAFPLFEAGLLFFKTININTHTMIKMAYLRFI